MENLDRLSVLLQKGSTTKAHVISFREFLAKIDTNNPAQISELQLRYNSVLTNFSNLDDLYDGIQLIDTETDHSNEKKFGIYIFRPLLNVKNILCLRYHNLILIHKQIVKKRFQIRVSETNRSCQ